MSGILKFGSESLGERVRPLAATFPSAALAADPERERLAGEVETLTAALAARDDAIARLDDDVVRALENGRAEGREAGREEAEDRNAELLANVEGAAERALAHFADQVGALERLALLVAQTCLDRMLLGSEERSRILGDLIRGQVAALSEGAAVRIQVSNLDFGSQDALARLAEAAASRGCEISASEALGSGDCVIGLRLGAMDVGLNQQWGALRSELDAMIETGGAT